ncbi:serine/arginine repetitive matrix protein 2-like isoform X3 [Mercenaria mercenaria]|uniref:serine/arginine repetitive matrix protein 2-like isoform X3 n=1 Tax=Mercenaria mercenaria TaxID=6596 RepID=UPI00234F017A|nr:serine/arginine repetitive matrix protein 2-like isoform X3 [Mercenaria mercenaria]
MASCARRTVQLEEDDLPYRKGSNATVRSEGTGTEYYAKRGMLPSYDSQETVRASRPVSTASNSSMRVRRLSSLTDDNTRFPKLQDCAHFHYDTVDINSLKVCLCDDDNEQYHHNGESTKYFYVKITSNDKTWLVRRTLQNFRMLDQKLHRCIFDRKFSHLPDVALIEPDVNTEQEVYGILGDYLTRFSSLAGSMLNCGSVLNWLEIDNRGNRILAVDDSGINTPAIAAAHAVKRYTAQAADEISLEVGDIISVIDMPPTEDTIWWRGKRGFEVGFFPFECVEIIGDKVPQAVVSGIPETPQNRALLKKHGKFISFLRLFFNTRPARIQLKQSGIVKERVFGCDLGEHLLNSGHDVPLVLKSCADVIESHGLVDGIYRLSGITSNIQKLRLAFDEDRVPDLTSEEYLQDVHSISSLLKMYFRELPNPLLTYQLYDKFANAVKDEDNKLLRIHDVVQQLPPPHYRTTEYLMRHLARVAAHGQETGMHSKNLAIVWAPNLLRSKELETGGGAAALQGVGIQAVVTEFLILYADIIFSDKMPSYSSPELKKTHKKPRPKSLAISTPTRLLSLEEARERALLGNFVKPDQRYIDVGGGPNNLPAKYHTVLDLPGYKKKGSKELKGKKSPGGLKSLFTKSRSGSIRQKGRKPSLQDFESGERKAITEEDVQHWKRRRIRSAKSAESLLSLPITSRLGSPLSESLDPNRLMNILADKENASPIKYRSMSVESPRPMASSQEYSISYPSFVLEDEGSREMAIDVNPNDIELDLSEAYRGERGSSESPDGVQRKQSFIRNDQKRKVICHRRTPSAPTTPRREGHEHSSGCRDVDESLQQYTDKSVSQPMLEVTLTSKPPKGSSGKIITRQDSETERFLVHSVSSESANEMIRSGDDYGSEKRKGSKTPPKDRKKLKDGKEKSPSVERHVGSKRDRSRRGSEKENIPCDSHDQETELIKQLPESPGSRRKLWSKSKSEEQTNTSSNTQVSLLFKSPYFFSRYHDYAEINDDDLDDAESHVNKSAEEGNRKSAPVTSECAIPNSSDKTHRYPVESINNVQEIESRSSRESKNVLETDFPAKNTSKNRNSVELQTKSGATKDTLKQSQSSDFASEISKIEHNLQNIQQSYSSAKPMSKCISIPSDIQKSLENIHSVNGSHSDIMSSITISELSVSQDNIYPGNEGNGVDRRRRSTSLDGLHDESPLSRTLREINAQIDQAFKHEKHKAQSLHDIQSSQTLSERSSEELSSELVSYEDELLVTPTGQRSFGSMRDMDSDRDDQINQNKFVDRPAAEIHIAEAPKVIRAPLRSGRQGETATTSTTPTRPSPPASLDIVSPSTSSQPLVGFTSSRSESVKDQGNTKLEDHSPYSNVPSKIGTRISEEDFQKILMSDPDSLKQFEQSMMYSPVRARGKGFPDGDRSGRSSVASPLEGSAPRSRSSRSSLTSPDASPGSHRGLGHNRSFGSPETSPLTSRPPRNQSLSSLEASPQSRQKHSQSLSSLDSSPQSKQRGKLKGSADISPTTRQKLNKSYGSAEGSPHLRQKQSQSLSSVEASPPSRQKQNQSFSSLEGSPHSRQKQNQSFSSVEASPPSRQKLNQSFSSSEGSPQSRQKLSQSTSSSDASPRQRHNQSFSSVESSPRSQQKHNQSFSSSEASPQTGARQKSLQYGASSPQRDVKKYSPRSGKKSSESPQHDRRSFIPQLKLEQRRSGSLVSSPMSPEHKQPRWEDLAGLNDSFNEIDMAVFNDNWKKCLAPTGDSIRLSGNASDSTEQLSSHTEPEVSTGTDTVVLERPSITRKGGSNLTPGNLEKAAAKSKKKEIETYDNVPEHEAFEIQHKSSRNEDNKVTTERPTIRRSQTLPAASSLPQSPVSAVTSPGGFLEHSSSFESSSSVSSLYHGSSYESATGFGTSGITTDRSGALRKSNTTPVLTRQTSFDSSYKKSVRVMSLGSSLEESDAECRSSRSNVMSQGQGSYVARSSGHRSASHQSSQSSVLMRSESNQSADFPFHDVSQSNAELNSSQSSIGTLLPQMLEEMDVNESCLGLASHQNMSNEMKEMMQEQMKEHAGILSPLDEVMAPFPNMSSPRLQQRSFFDTNPLSGFDMESSIEIPSDVGLLSLPEIHLQIISDGPVVIATPMVLSQLTPIAPEVHHPIDNTEEAFQNAVNDDLERNMASLQNYQPQHVSVCEPAIRIHDPNSRMQNESFVNVAGSRIPEHSPGLEHLVAVSADSVQVMDTPPPVMQDSMSSSTSSQVDLMSTSFTYPQNFDSWHYYSPMVNSLSLPGDLAPPPLEMIEQCKSTLVLSKPKSSQEKKPKSKQAKPNEILITWEYPKILDENGKEKVKKRTESLKSAPTTQGNISSERGEEKLVLDNKPCFKKSTAADKQSKPTNLHIADLVDSDHAENSGSEDDVFVDPSEVTPETSFYAAGSKYFQRRDFLSYGHMPSNDQGANGETRDNRVFSFELPSRSSFDETLIIANRQKDAGNKESDFAGFHDDLMDIGHENSEDIRFSKAHRSSKLLTLCEKFEKETGPTSPAEVDESGKKKTITPPEKNIVSSIRQMHESLEYDGKDGKTENFGKTQKVNKVDENKLKADTICLSPTGNAPAGQGRLVVENVETSQKSPSVPSAARSIPTLQGKPPLCRTSSKTRTPSESSLGEIENVKVPVKSNKTEGSPKSRYDGSPKGQRQSVISSEDGSPKLLPHSSSPKGQRYSTEISPKLARGKEGPPVMPRQGGSPTASRSETSSKIPVFRQSSFTKDDAKSDSSLRKLSSSPKNLRHSWCSSESEHSSKYSKDSDHSKMTRKEHHTGQSKQKSETVGQSNGQKKYEKCDKAEKKKRRGSIKELTNIFEEKIENLGKGATSPSPTQVKLRSRVRSVSPNSAVNKSPTLPTNVRHSMELPSRDIAHHSDGTFKGAEANIKLNSVRIGPKPFYGAK